MSPTIPHGSRDSGIVIDLTNEPDTPPRSSKSRHGSSSQLDRKPMLRIIDLDDDVKPGFRLSTPSTTKMSQHENVTVISDDEWDIDESEYPPPSPPRLPQLGFKIEKQKQIETSPPVTLSEEQQDVLDAVLAGESLFFTGSAGEPEAACRRRLVLPYRSSLMTILIRYWKVCVITGNYSCLTTYRQASCCDCFYWYCRREHRRVDFTFVRW